MAITWRELDAFSLSNKTMNTILLRGGESYAQKWDYVRANPVRAGLVSEAESWPYAGEIVVIDRF